MNLLTTLIITQLAAQATHTLSLSKRFGIIRASSFMTLVFIGFTSLYPLHQTQTLQAAFLGSTFVGMTDPKRLSRLQIFLATVIFSLIFTFFTSFLKGPGGILGLSAFISCLIIHFIWRFLSPPSL